MALVLKSSNCFIFTYRTTTLLGSTHRDQSTKKTYREEVDTESLSPREADTERVGESAVSGVSGGVNRFATPYLPIIISNTSTYPVEFLLGVGKTRVR